MYIYFKHVAHIKVIDTLMIQNYIVHSTLFLHRVLPATDESIQQLTGLKGTPLAYLLSSGLPVEDTVVGTVELGSPLPYHVSMVLSFNSSSLLIIMKYLLSMNLKYVPELGALYRKNK